MRPGPATSAGRLRGVHIGPWNHLAVIGLSASLDEPGDTNPIFLHGPDGLGKSHLLSSYTGALRRRYPAWAIVSVAGRTLVRSYQRAIYEKTIHDFRERYRAADALVVDGVDELSHKPSCQGELLATFNVLASRRRPIVLSSRVSPRALTDFLPQLANRFLAGLTVGLSPLDPSTLRGLVHAWGKRFRPPVPDEILVRLADSFRGTPAELDRLLGRLDGYRRGSRRPIDARVLQEALRLTESGYGNPDLDQIVAAVTDHFGLEADDLSRVQTTRRTTLARRIAIYLATELTSIDRREIGQRLGRRTQATVRHARAEVKKRLLDDESVQSAIETIRRRLGS